MFFDRYKELCQAEGLSLSAAAEKAGFNKGTVSVWKKKYEEQKDVRPEPDIIEKICIFFKCDESWLLGIEKKENTANQAVDGLNQDYFLLSEENKAFIDEMIVKLLKSQSPD